MKPINDLLATHGVPVYDPDDATLSSGEHVQAIIVAALNSRAYWDEHEKRVGAVAAKAE